MLCQTWLLFASHSCQHDVWMHLFKTSARPSQVTDLLIEQVKPAKPPVLPQSGPQSSYGQGEASALFLHVLLQHDMPLGLDTASN